MITSFRFFFQHSTKRGKNQETGKKKEEWDVYLPEKEPARDVWQTLKEETRPIVVYGMGNGADKLFDRFAALGIPVADIFASDGFVRGQSFRGLRVKTLSEIRTLYRDFVIVVAFASNKPDVIEALRTLDGEETVFYPDLPVAGTECFDLAFYRAHRAALEETYALFADEESRALYRELVAYRLDGKMAHLFLHTSTDEEIYRLLAKKPIRTAIDAGAYNGDTAKKLLENIPDVTKIYAIEPDPKTFRRLLRFAGKEARVVPVPGAVWSSEGCCDLHASGNRNTSLVGASYEHRDIGIRLIPIDKFHTGCPVDYIKYDVEGAEREGLLGARETVRRDRPALLVSLYHRSEDLFSLVLLCRDLCENYRFFLRRTLCLPAWETALVALPAECV